MKVLNLHKRMLHAFLKTFPLMEQHGTSLNVTFPVAEQFESGAKTGGGQALSQKCQGRVM